METHDLLFLMVRDAVSQKSKTIKIGLSLAQLFACGSMVLSSLFLLIFCAKAQKMSKEMDVFSDERKS